MCTEHAPTTFVRNIFFLYKYLWTYVRVNLEINAETRIDLHAISSLIVG
jgi:hypothetical protein